MRCIIDGDIVVFSDGSVRLPSGKITKGSKAVNGYMRVSIKKKFYYVHRLIATQFIPNPDNLPQVNHKDMDPSNNEVSNLEWCDNGGNVKHSYDNNPTRKTTIPGNSRKSKLTNEQVLWVIENLGKISQREMARQLGVSHRVIFHIKTGRTHSNITGIKGDCL